MRVCICWNAARRTLLPPTFRLPAVYGIIAAQLVLTSIVAAVVVASADVRHFMLAHWGVQVSRLGRLQLGRRCLLTTLPRCRCFADWAAGCVHAGADPPVHLEAVAPPQPGAARRVDLPVLGCVCVCVPDCFLVLRVWLCTLLLLVMVMEPEWFEWHPSLDH